jgi:hypothetical protein
VCAVDAPPRQCSIERGRVGATQGQRKAAATTGCRRQALRSQSAQRDEADIDSMPVCSRVRGQPQRLHVGGLLIVILHTHYVLHLLD